jgi:predicted transposase YbfD/YdcC
LTLATVTPEQLGFPHAATAVAVTSAVTNKQTCATSGETRHFASSLERGALTPRQWLARVRGHWRVESANHYRRDVTWREDAELGRQARRVCNLALLRSALLRDGSLNLSALTQHYASHPAAALRFLCSSRPTS